jgi:hypothetical protein
MNTTPRQQDLAEMLKAISTVKEQLFDVIKVMAELDEEGRKHCGVPTDTQFVASIRRSIKEASDKINRLCAAHVRKFPD